MDWEKQALTDHKQDLMQMIKEQEEVLLNKINENKNKLKNMTIEPTTSFSPLKK